MAIIIGVVSIKEHRKIVEAGYDLASFDDVKDTLLHDYSEEGEVGDHGVAVWVDCDVTDLLSPNLDRQKGDQE